MWRGRAAGFQRRRHSQRTNTISRSHHLAFAAGIAHHRRRAVRKYARHRRQVPAPDAQLGVTDHSLRK